MPDEQGSSPVEAVGVDVGGTKVNAVRIDAAGGILARAEEATPAEDPEATLAALVVAARAVVTPEVVGVGVGAAGLVERDTGILTYAPNIAWRDADIPAVVRDGLGLPARVDNDCTAAGYAEWRLGAARGLSDVLYVGLGTGIGGAIVMNGQLCRGAAGFAGEIGHVIVEPDGPVCGCGNRGCWETVASGSAIDRQARAAVNRHTHSAIAERAGGDPSKVTGSLVTEMARDGDPAARGILVEVGMRLGQGIAGLVNVLDPEMVVVGGGVAEAGDLLLEPARDAYVRAVESGAGRRPVPIVIGELGPDAAAIGAALMILDGDGR